MNSKKLLTNRNFAIASVLSLLFFVPLLLVIIPLWIWTAVKNKLCGGNEAGASGTGPRPVGPLPHLDKLTAPFGEIDNGNFQFHAMRFNALLERLGGDMDFVVDDEFKDSRSGNAWFCSIVPDVNHGGDAIQLFAYPFGVQYLEIDKAKWHPGSSPNLDRAFSQVKETTDMVGDGAASANAGLITPAAFGGDFEKPIGSDEKSGSGFTIDSVECGASPQNPGVRIVFHVKGSGRVGTPQRREDVPFLFVTFSIGEMETSFLAPPSGDKPEWRFDEVFAMELGVVDIAGDIPFVATIVNHRGSRLSQDSITPRSNVAKGLVRATSSKVSV